MKMSSDHQDSIGFQPPSTVEELHRQPPSSTTGDNLSDSTTLRLPHTPPPMAPTIETNTPESPIAAILSDAIFTTPSTSFDSAASATTTTVNTHNPACKTLTDPNSSANQDPPTISTTPPTVSEKPRRNTLVRRSILHPIKTDFRQPQENKAPPGVSTHKQIPQSKLREMGDQVREIKQRYSDVMRQYQEHAENDDPRQATVDQEQECVRVERPHGGCFRFQLSCSCGKRRGICSDAAFFLNIILIFCVFFMIGLTYSILLDWGISFTEKGR
ncbi:hypothetical protein L1887_31480 [Cichorium endivia]|nr:hypothetical protein L1887_31480 [Cichorium endivia]